MKACTKCLETKPFTEFYKNGRESQCRGCRNKWQQNYAYPNRDAPRGQKSSERRKQTQARYREKHRDKIREMQRRYVRENKAKVLSRTRKYQLAKRNATPKWLTKDHFTQIEVVYLKAEALRQEMGGHFEVDHIVPLSGRDVSGLHVPWNLQIIDRHSNRAKHNKY